MERWDVAFLLDVLEHIPEDDTVLRRIYDGLVPGGLLFVTTPALSCFWSWNDVFAKHQRRYSKQDFRRLGAARGFRVLETSYFMFFLSPLLLLSRWMRRPHVPTMTAEERKALMARTHSVPTPIVNYALRLVFSVETASRRFIAFPWGTSILVVLQKPMNP